MENTMVSHINTKELNYKLLVTTINHIKKFVKENDYQFKDEDKLNEISERKFNEALSIMSKKKKKKLASYIWTVTNHPSFASINKFFHFLMKNVLQSDVRIRIVKSDKEIAIQEKRKAYKEALALANAARVAYKQEKGDFYKIRLAKNVKL